jgi:hypothetical protein
MKHVIMTKEVRSVPRKLMLSLTCIEFAIQSISEQNVLLRALFWGSYKKLQDNHQFLIDGKFKLPPWRQFKFTRKCRIISIAICTANGLQAVPSKKINVDCGFVLKSHEEHSREP